MRAEKEAKLSKRAERAGDKRSIDVDSDEDDAKPAKKRKRADY